MKFPNSALGKVASITFFEAKSKNFGTFSFIFDKIEAPNFVHTYLFKINIHFQKFFFGNYLEKKLEKII